MRYIFHRPPQILVGHPLVCIVIDSMPEIGCRFIYAGLIFSLLSITLHHPNHISHYCLLSIAAASPIPPKWAPDIAYMLNVCFRMLCWKTQMWFLRGSRTWQNISRTGSPRGMPRLYSTIAPKAALTANMQTPWLSIAVFRYRSMVSTDTALLTAGM